MTWSGIDWSAASWEQVRARHRWVVPARLNIAAVACDRHADGSGRLALVAEGPGGVVTRHSFDELRASSTRLARAFAALGVERESRVAVFLPQRLEAALAHLAAFRLGAVSLPLSPLFRADALVHRLGSSGARVLVTDADHLPFVLECRSRLPANLAVVSCDGPAPGVEDFGQLVAAHDDAPLCADTAADDPAILMYTSGTVGLPKGALHAHRLLVGRLSGFELIHRFEAQPFGDRPFYTPADWAWVAGLVDSVLVPWLFGAPVLAVRPRGFDPAGLAALATRHRVEAMFLPPTAIQLLRRAEDPAAPWRIPLRSVHFAGEPLTAEAHAWATRAFGSMWPLYGLTEIGAVVGSAPLAPVPPGCMGRPLPGHRVELQDDDGRPVRAGETGEVVVHRQDPGMFLAYDGDPTGTAERFRDDWFRTADLARCDADGILWYQGRTDDVFKVSGYRVGPTEIEQCLEAHPAVERAAVVGEPDPARGASVKAFVILRTGVASSDALAAELQEHVRARLASYEVPRRIVFAAELPLTVTGKLRRVALRAPDAEARFGRS